MKPNTERKPRMSVLLRVYLSVRPSFPSVRRSERPCVEECGTLLKKMRALVFLQQLRVSLLAYKRWLVGWNALESRGERTMARCVVRVRARGES